jgi:heme/copper-type cytochrome/quinol oxidase subunit 2
MENIVSIAADRFLMVAFPFKHHSWMSGKKTLIWIILIWMASSFLHGTMISSTGSNAYNIDAMDIYAAIIIISIAGLLYMLTLFSLRKQARNLARHNPECESSSTQRIRELRQRRFLNTIILVACITVIGTVPCFVVRRVLMTKGIHYHGRIAIEILWCFVLTLFYATFAINPLVYFLRLPNYRKTFYLLYWRRNSR